MSKHETQRRYRLQGKYSSFGVIKDARDESQGQWEIRMYRAWPDQHQKYKSVPDNEREFQEQSDFYIYAYRTHTGGATQCVRLHCHRELPSTLSFKEAPAIEMTSRDGKTVQRNKLPKIHSVRPVPMEPDLVEEAKTLCQEHTGLLLSARLRAVDARSDNTEWNERDFGDVVTAKDFEAQRQREKKSTEIERGKAKSWGRRIRAEYVGDIGDGLTAKQRNGLIK